MARLAGYKDGSLLSVIPTMEVDPGQTEEYEFDVKNIYTSAITNVMMRLFPEKENLRVKSGYNISSAEIIRMTTAKVAQKVSVAKEDADAVCTARNSREIAYLYNGANYIDYSDGEAAAYFMNGATHKFYAGVDYKAYCLALALAIAGSYTGLAIKYYNGSSWVAITGVDGSSSLTSSGVITLDAADVAAWEKIEINGKTMYWLEFSCTAVTTQAVTEASAGLYWAYVYDLPYSCLYGTGTYYEKTDDATPVYTEKTPNIEYSYYGQVVYAADPLGDPAYELVGAFDYKTPQPGTYEIEWQSTNTLKWRFEGGDWSSVIVVDADGETAHISIINGISLVFQTSANINASETTVIEISEAVRHMWTKIDGGTYANEDCTVSASLAAGVSQTVDIASMPPQDVSATTNSNSYNILLHGD